MLPWKRDHAGLAVSHNTIPEAGSQGGASTASLPVPTHKDGRRVGVGEREVGVEKGAAQGMGVVFGGTERAKRKKERQKEKNNREDEERSVAELGGG